MPVEQGALGSETGVRERGRMKPAGVHVRTDDGVELALHRVSGAVWQGCPVLLTHGTFSNGQVCAGLAGFLADHGFDCWVLELQIGRASCRERVPTARRAGSSPRSTEAWKASSGD